MVGGKIIGISIKEDKTALIHVQDSTYKKDRCSIRVKLDNGMCKYRNPGVNDQIWWQGRKAFWTPEEFHLSVEESEKKGHKQGLHWDIPLTRIGYSH